MINRLRGKYTQVDNNVLNEKISLKAKWLYAFLCSKPDNWEFSYSWLIFQLKEWEKSIRSAVKELVDLGVLLRITKRKEKWCFKWWDWIINPTQEDLNKYKDPNGQNRKYPKPEVPETGSSQNGKDISNTNISNTNINNTKEREQEKIQKNKEKFLKQQKESETFFYNYENNKNDFIFNLMEIIELYHVKVPPELLNNKELFVTEVDKFCNYWITTEKNWKLVWENQKTFVVWLRLNTWLSNYKPKNNFKNNNIWQITKL